MIIDKTINEIYQSNKEIIDTTSLEFLSDEYILNTSWEIDLDSNISNLLVDLKNTILKNETTKALLKTYISMYFTNNKGYLPSFFDFSHLFSGSSDLFFLLVAVSKVKDLKAFYHKKNIPESILLDTLSDIKIWTNTHKKKTGNLGLSELHWLHNHLNGELFKIGRLQFSNIPFKGDVMLFRQASTGFPLLLSYGDVKYDFLGNKTDEKEDFISTYIESDITITAHPIREGKCQRNPITINKCDYSLEIKKDTPLLNMHIQEGEKLDISLCIDSMREAIKFYYKYFNSEVIKGFTCSSWLLNRNFREILYEDSNIRKFSSMFYEYPSIPNYNQMYQRVFNGERNLGKLTSIENKTSLQESIVNGLNSGLTFQDASVIFPSYDIRKLERFRI